MLIHRSGTLYEDMYWIDPETMRIVASETSGSLEQRIVYSSATKKAIRGKEGLLTIHSHPNSFPPSLEDFNANFVNGNGMGIVCCHDGRIYKYWAEEMVSKERYVFYHQSFYKKFRDEDEAQRNTWEELKSNYDIVFEEVLYNESIRWD